jgi:UDP-2,3-diacylglucosamine pyrophosphatase LpxH
VKEPVRVYSDLHLGNKVSRIDSVNSLRPLIAGAGTVIFNGDTWQELAGEMRDRSRRMLDELRALCAEEGCDTIFLSGNHDPGWPGPGWLELAEGRVVVTHGDALLHDSSPWKHEVLANPDEVRRVWSQHPDAATNVAARLRVARAIARNLPTRRHATGRKLWHRVGNALRPPRRGLRMIEAWLTQGTIGARFCDRYFPAAQFLLIGHFHWQGTWLRGNRRVINTGSFVYPGRADYVELANGWLKRGTIVEERDVCRLGVPLDVWRLA